MSAAADRDAAAARWLRRHLHAVREWSWLAIVAGVTASLSYAAFAYLVAQAAQAWIAGNDIAASTPWLALAAVLARGACHATRDWAGARAAIVVRANARAEVLDALERLGPLRARLGDDGALATLAIEQVDALDGYVARYAPQRIVAVVVPLAIVALVLPHSWLAALLLTLTAPLIPLFMTLVGYGAAAASREQADALARLGGRFLDLVRGLPTLRLLAAADVGVQRLADGANEYRSRMLRVLRLAFLSSSVLEFFASAAIAMVALYLGLALLGRFDTGHYGAIDLRSALFILLLAPEFYAPLRQLGADYHARADAVAAADAIGAALAAAPPRPQGAATATPRDDAPAIEFDNVTLRHADGRVALDGVSFRITRGERVALRGASGAGKSSVLALLAGFARPTSGTVRIDGVDLAQLDRAAWWRRLGWLDQRPEWFRRSIRENVLLGADVDASRFETAIERAGLAEVIAALPRGADGVIGEADGSLSGGQLQRVALARALVRDADVWLLDEPTAHLDAETAETLVATLGACSSPRPQRRLRRRPLTQPSPPSELGGEGLSDATPKPSTPSPPTTLGEKAGMRGRRAGSRRVSVLAAEGPYDATQKPSTPSPPTALGEKAGMRGQRARSRRVSVLASEGPYDATPKPSTPSPPTASGEKAGMRGQRARSRRVSVFASEGPYDATQKPSTPSPPTALGEKAGMRGRRTGSRRVSVFAASKIIRVHRKQVAARQANQPPASAEMTTHGITVLLATHAETPAWIDRELVLVQGRLTEPRERHNP
ncbi:thiol reductant ABC exporter subunit CydD [Tahibacter soli]|uniref:Thiol reductant ABC exporter subunit CydD n=1 Tax=Tahibacter soli TaxID=2983605 RepID=A0A9X3YGM8_9GAMM|nr:thiol reductant ABC exporter subunit CydD [Tahibacter soli]MDC8011826.1 thiol reductant ABC exporter subunit CydD [Tahibacter soli]